MRKTLDPLDTPRAIPNSRRQAARSSQFTALMVASVGALSVSLAIAACGGSSTDSVAPPATSAGDTVATTATGTGGANTSTTATTTTTGTGGKGTTVTGTGGAGTGGAGTGGAGTGGAGTGGAGTGGAVPTCTLGAACDLANGNGLCDGTNCNPCVDPTDDANCATVYGKGNFCIAGVCTTGCRMASDCPNNAACTNNQCAATCASDLDCAASPATPICTIATGVCVAATCATATGTACTANASDLCCSSVCISGATCCGANGTACNGGTCQNNLCVAGGCAAPVNNTLYVDAAAVAGGNGGSPGCAFKTIIGAIGKLTPGIPGTIIVRGGTTYTAIDSHVIPTNVTITGGEVGTGVGAASAFVACVSPADCPTASWPVITTTPTDIVGFTFASAGPSELKFLTLVGPPQANGVPTSTKPGISIIGTTASQVTLSRLRISQFADGIDVGAAGNAAIKANVQATKNVVGLACSTGSTTSITLAVGDVVTTFDGNTGDGIVVVQGATKFTIAGPVQALETVTPDTTLVGASNNGGSGVHFAATAVGAGSITGLEAQGNTDAGVKIFTGASLVLRGSSIHGDNNGISIQPVGAAPYSVANIDLGTDAAANAGKNQFYANAGAGVCVNAAVADSVLASAKFFSVAGNSFSNPPGATKDCTLAKGTMSKLAHAVTCAGGVNLSDNSDNRFDVDNCVPQ